MVASDWLRRPQLLSDRSEEKGHVAQVSCKHNQAQIENEVWKKTTPRSVDQIRAGNVSRAIVAIQMKGSHLERGPTAVYIASNYQFYLVNVEVHFRRRLKFSFKSVCSFSPHKVPLFMLRGPSDNDKWSKTTQRVQQDLTSKSKFGGTVKQKTQNALWMGVNVWV